MSGSNSPFFPTWNFFLTIFPSLILYPYGKRPQETSDGRGKYVLALNKVKVTGKSRGTAKTPKPPESEVSTWQNMIWMFFFTFRWQSWRLDKSFKKSLFCPIPSHKGEKRKRFLLLSVGPAPKLSFAWLRARTRCYVAHSTLWGLPIPSTNVNKQLSLHSESRFGKHLLARKKSFYNKSKRHFVFGTEFILQS